MDLSGFNKPGFQISLPKSSSAKVNQSKSPSGLKGFIINALPSITGGIGLIGGEALDPFGGGLITGGAASAAGEALKEKLLGQSISPKQAAIQAGETAALGGLGKLLGAGRSTSKAILQGTKAAPEIDTATEVAETVPKPTIGQRIGKAGQNLEAKLGSFAPGQKISGRQLDVADTNKIIKTLSDENIGGLGARDRAEQVESKLNSLGKIHNQLTTINNADLSEEEKLALASEVQDRLTNPNNDKYAAGGASSTVQKYANSYLDAINKSKDLSALGRLKTGLDSNEIKYGGSIDSAQSAKNIAARTTRGVINDFMNSKVPGLDTINNRMSNLYEAKGALLNAAAKTANLTTGAEGLWGRILSGETAEKSKAVAAKALKKAGGSPVVATENIIKSTPGIKEQIAGRTIAPLLGAPIKTATKVGTQIGGRGIGSLLLNPQSPEDNTQSNILPNTSLTQNLPATSDSSSEQTTGPYPEENMLYDIERDPKNASTYEALYKLLNTNSQSVQQQNDVDNSTNALSALQIYAQNLQQAGGAKSGILGTLENLGVRAKVIQGPTAGAITALRGFKAELAAQLAKTVTGSRPNQQQIDYYMDALPDVSDTPAAAQQKISNLESILNARIKNASNQSQDASSSTSDITDLAALLGQ